MSSPPLPHGGILPESKRVMNLSHFLRQATRRHGQEIGFVWGERTWTWAELDGRVDAMAAALAAKGIRKGDRVLVQSKNCNQMFESMFACFRLGAIWVPTNFRQTPGEVAYLAQASGASAMICHSDFPEHAKSMREAAPDIRFVISIGHSDFGEDYDELVALHAGQSAPTAAVNHDDPCWFFFTSGTTGRPKAAVLTHGQMAFVITNHLCDLMPGTTSADASLVVAPLSHGAGVHQLVQVARAAKTVLLVERALRHRRGLDAGRKVAHHEPLYRADDRETAGRASFVDAHDHSSLRYVIYAGAPMYREDQKHALKKLGKVLVQYFGLGEVTGNITVLPPALHEHEDGPGVKHRHLRLRAHRHAGFDPG
jgi:fatty-acyl-CoA synthase